jgi:hypothetical protein
MPPQPIIQVASRGGTSQYRAREGRYDQEAIY